MIVMSKHAMRPQYQRIDGNSIRFVESNSRARAAYFSASRGRTSPRVWGDRQCVVERGYAAAFGRLVHDLDDACGWWREPLLMFDHGGTVIQRFVSNLVSYACR